MVRLVAVEASGCDIRNNNGEGEARVPDRKVTGSRGVAHIWGMSPHPPACAPVGVHRDAMSIRHSTEGPTSVLGDVRRPAEEPA